MGVLLRILRERAEAEDALQEVYTRVWLRAGRYDPAKGRGMTWLIAIARNLAIDRLRARARGRLDDGLDTVARQHPSRRNPADRARRGAADVRLLCHAGTRPRRCRARCLSERPVLRRPGRTPCACP